MPKEHDLKCYPEHFQAVKRGDKTSELRLDDRRFKKGDLLNLHEWDPGTAEYTGDVIKGLEVTHLVRGPAFGLFAGHVMLSFRPTVVIPRQVERPEDMSADGFLKLILQEDGDVVVQVYGQHHGDPASANVEFCVGAGGGRSPRTVEALKLLMAAMQADNTAGPFGRNYERQHRFELGPEDRDFSR